MSDELSAKWSETQARLPNGWKLEGLRCASASLRPEDRSDDWIAVAIGPDGQETSARAADPISALNRIAELLLAR